MPQHLALYRKYRPQSFDEVVGQEQIVTLLQSSIKTKKISHAYLFCGGRGTGKTTVARIFARDIGCNGEDIIEIDAASNRGIDEIRELRDAVRTSPFSSPYKVYIIDEAHMLTKEAANALLKTLEEPPSHVIFILATTDPDKLPSTVVSRCQKIVFKSPDISTLAAELIVVAKKEGITLTQESATVLATHGKGSYRDSLGILEQVLQLPKTGNTIIHERITTFLGEPEDNKSILILEALCLSDEKSIITILADCESVAYDALRLYDTLIEIIRQGLLHRIGKVTSANEKLQALVVAHPRSITSALILELLTKRDLVEKGSSHAYIAVEAILLHYIHTHTILRT